MYTPPPHLPSAVPAASLSSREGYRGDPRTRGPGPPTNHPVGYPVPPTRPNPFDEPLRLFLSLIGQYAVPPATTLGSIIPAQGPAIVLLAGSFAIGLRRQRTPGFTDRPPGRAARFWTIYSSACVIYGNIWNSLQTSCVFPSSRACRAPPSGETASVLRVGGGKKC